MSGRARVPCTLITHYSGRAENRRGPLRGRSAAAGAVIGEHMNRFSKEECPSLAQSVGVVLACS